MCINPEYLWFTCKETRGFPQAPAIRSAGAGYLDYDHTTIRPAMASLAGLHQGIPGKKHDRRIDPYRRR